MLLRLPFFGMLSHRSPMQGLIEHYDKISEAMRLIEESMECYVAGGTCSEYKELCEQVDALEDKADKIKRSIRNHLPRGLFMAVDKPQFLNYTRSQDNILDAGQDALHWLGMRRITIPEPLQKQVVNLLAEVTTCVDLLRPALESTISLVEGKSLDRNATKETYRAVRKQHKVVWKLCSQIMSDVLNSDMEHKDVFQFIRYLECLDTMSHSSEGCADTLRTMIAR